MKLFAILAAGFVAAAAMVPAAASAQDHGRVVKHVVVRHGPAHRQVCRTVFNHGHRTRVCR